MDRNASKLPVRSLWSSPPHRLPIPRSFDGYRFHDYSRDSHCALETIGYVSHNNGLVSWRPAGTYRPQATGHSEHLTVQHYVCRIRRAEDPSTLQMPDRRDRSVNDPPVLRGRVPNFFEHWTATPVIRSNFINVQVRLIGGSDCTGNAFEGDIQYGSASAEFSCSRHASLWHWRRLKKIKTITVKISILLYIYIYIFIGKSWSATLFILLSLNTWSLTFCRFRIRIFCFLLFTINSQNKYILYISEKFTISSVVKSKNPCLLRWLAFEINDYFGELLIIEFNFIRT